jgi:hypothetical protein
MQASSERKTKECVRGKKNNSGGKKEVRGSGEKSRGPRPEIKL